MRIRPRTTLVLILFCAGAVSAEPPAGPPKVSTTPAAGGEFDQFEGEFGAETGKPAKKVFDPIEGFNRVMFKVNDKFYFWLAKPLARVYGFLLPQPVRVAVGRGFENLQAPLRMANHALQGRADPVGTELGRFIVNSTLGLGGLFDPADKWFHAKQVDADFGQTLGHYGVGTGFPLTLPLLGQTNFRDGVGMVPNSMFDPTYYFTSGGVYLAETAASKTNLLSLHIGDYEKIKKDALDPYTFIRDAHLQNREEKIKESRGNVN